MTQLLLHLFGDFIVQNDWMAMNKHSKGFKNLLICVLHCLTYALPFFLITGWLQVTLIFLSHLALDRTTLVTKFLMLRNNVKDPSNFGFHNDRPFTISVWLNIITDNSIHLITNYLIITIC